MAIQKKPGGANKPQAYSTEDGKFVSTGASGSSSGNNNAAAASSAPANSLFNKLFSASNSNNNQKPSLADRLFSPINSNNDSDEEDFNSYLEKLNSRDNDSNWHKTHAPLTVDELIDNIDKYVSDNILDFIRRYPRANGGYLWHMPNLGGVQSRHGYPVTFLNAIAEEQFVPAQLIDRQTFNEILREIRIFNNNRDVGFALPAQGQFCHLQRGSHDISATLGFAGLRKSDLYLTNGAYDSCVYSAYDGQTAQGYASGTNYKGQPGHITEIIFDQSKAKFCKQSVSDQMRYDFLQKKNIWKPKINQALLDKGLSQQEADNFMFVIEKAFDRDRNSVAIACGYDMVYVPSMQYSLIFNWKHCKILNKGYK